MNSKNTDKIGFLPNSKKIKKVSAKPQAYLSPTENEDSKIKKYQIFSKAQKLTILSGLQKALEAHFGKPALTPDELIEYMQTIELTIYNKIIEDLLALHAPSILKTKKNKLNWQSQMKQWRKQLKSWIKNLHKPDKRGGIRVIASSDTEEFKQKIIQIIQSLPYRSFRLLRVEAIRILERMHKINNPDMPFNKNTFSKHFWYDFMKLHQEIRELYESLPIVWNNFGRNKVFTGKNEHQEDTYTDEENQTVPISINISSKHTLSAGNEFNLFTDSTQSTKSENQAVKEEEETKEGTVAELCKFEAETDCNNLTFKQEPLPFSYDIKVKQDGFHSYKPATLPDMSTSSVPGLKFDDTCGQIGPIKCDDIGVKEEESPKKCFEKMESGTEKAEYDFEAHFNVINTFRHFSDACSQRGHPEKTVEVLQKAEQSFQAECPEEDTKVKDLQRVGLLQSFSVVFNQTGKYKEAIEYLSEAMKLCRKHNVNSEAVGTILVMMGDAFIKLGEYQKAANALGHGVAITEKCYGKGHPGTGSAMLNLSIALGKLGHYQQEYNILIQILPIFEEHYGNSHSLIGLVLGNIGNLLMRFGEPKKAIEVFARALKIFEACYPPEDPKIGQIYASQGIASIELRDYKEAINLLTKALTIKEKAYGADHPEVGQILMNIGNAWDGQGEHQKAIELLTKALEIHEKSYQPDHPEVARNFMNLGIAWIGLGEYLKSADFISKSLEIKEKLYGADHPETALALTNLSRCYSGLKDHKKQHELLKRATIIFTKYNHPHAFACSKALTEVEAALTKNELVEKAKLEHADPETLVKWEN